jgi:hypothetical protein
MDEYVRSFISAEEAVSLGVVEPLDGAFQTFHVRPPFFANLPKMARFQGPAKKCVGIVLLKRGTVKARDHVAKVGWSV